MFSIRRRLLISIGALLVLVIGASIWFAYTQVSIAAYDVGRERLQSLSQQFVLISQQSAAVGLGRTLSVANDSAVRSELESPSPANRSAALKVLQQFAPGQDPNSVQVELWKADRTLALTLPEGSAPLSADLDHDFQQTSHEPFRSAGALRMARGEVVGNFSAAVRDLQGKPIGFLVRWRRISLNPNPSQLSALLGNDAKLYFGNAADDVWTDLTKRVSNPPPSLNGDVLEYARDGRTVLALERSIDGTPWAVTIEISSLVFANQARSFLRRTILVTLVILLAGITAAFMISGSITRPLQTLTQAAGAISSGDYSQTMSIRRNDEIGKLSQAFITMVGKVRDTQRDLERKASLFDQTYDAVFVWEWGGAITFWNRGAERMYGFTREEALGKSPSELLMTKPLDEANLFTRALEKSGQWEGELEHTTRDGSRIIIETRMVLIREDESPYVIEITRDVTERKKAEAALFRSERQYRLLFESNPLPMWVFDIETLAFLAVNEAAIVHYGFSREEFLSMTVEQIRPPEELPRLRQALANYAKKLSRSGVWQHRKKNGDVIDVEITAHPINFSNRLAELVLANDITERLRAQAELRQRTEELSAITQQLWQASKLATMGELAASVAHELNNPLATIALRTELLVAQLSESSNKRESAQIILTEVERMATLVDNLLQFSRRSHRQVSTIDVAEEISNSVNFIAYYLRNRSVSVQTDFGPEVPPIQADRQQLRQLFLNLLTNAADAMPDGGTLVTRTAAARVGEEKAALIEFIDSGVGIPTENLNRIWDSFFTTKPEGKGTGLGLAICRRIVEEHGGTIEIESQVGHGTTVRLSIPAANGTQPTIYE